jgi:hypothetical protein
MEIYAHYGHKDFIPCLGYQGEVIRAFRKLDLRCGATVEQTRAVLERRPREAAVVLFLHSLELIDIWLKVRGRRCAGALPDEERLRGFGELL